MDTKEVSEQPRKDLELKDGGLCLEGPDSIWGAGWTSQPPGVWGLGASSSIKQASCFGNTPESSHPVPAIAPQFTDSGAFNP